MGLVPSGSFDAETSAVWVAIAGGWLALLFAFTLARFLVYRRRCVHAEEVERGPTGFCEGATVVGGCVETDDGEPAIRFEIDQRGTEREHKRTWSHVWRETARRVQVRPFYVRLDDDQRVLVLPDDKVKLVDDLETGHWKNNERTRVSEVCVGERVWVRGVLSREGREGSGATAYRGGEAPFVMRRSRFEPVDVSSGSLTTRYTRWRRFYRVSAIILAVLFTFVQLFVFGSYYVQCLFGRVEIAMITGTSTSVTTSKRSTTRHYVVEAKLADGTKLKDDVTSSVYESARRKKIVEVPFRYVPFARFIHSIGVSAVASIGWIVIVIIIAFVATISLAITRASSVPWYEQRRVVERRSGRIHDHAWDKQVPSNPDLYVSAKKPEG